MALGYGLGPVFLDRPARARSSHAARARVDRAFLLLRGTNFYGDPHPWGQQRDSMRPRSQCSTSAKYPPSLLYALVTLGSALLLLPAMERFGGFAGEVLATFGRVPAFSSICCTYMPRMRRPLRSFSLKL